MLLSLFPHACEKGIYSEAAYPDGVTETLLRVPRYDWHTVTSWPAPSCYQLEPCSRALRCRRFPCQPGQSIERVVHYGKLTTDEMFHGYFDAALVRTSRLPTSPRRSSPRLVARSAAGPSAAADKAEVTFALAYT
jgi:hypothetical protein